MSAGQIHIFVRDRDFGDRTLKNVLERIAWFADEEGQSVYPKLQTIADALGLKLRAVQYQMRALEKKKLIKVEEEARQHRPRVYRLNVKAILAKPLTGTARRRLELENAAAPGVQSTTSPDPQGCNPRHPGVQTTTPGVQSTTSPPDGLKKTPARFKSSEESLEESEEESRVPPCGPPPIRPRDDIFGQQDEEADHGQQCQRPEPKPAKPESRGAFIDRTWQPKPGHVDFGRRLGLDERRVAFEADKFRDYWLGESGQRARKRDWDAAFRVWLRRAAGEPHGGPGRTGGRRPGPDRRGPASLVAAVDSVPD